MNRMHTGLKGACWIAVWLGLAGVAVRAQAEGNIDTANKFAWSEAAGWLNFAPTHGGVTVLLEKSGYLSGYAWAENIGWIKLGSDAGGPYANTGADDWGVNLNEGALSGFAWSETCGWINFSPTHGQVTVNVISGEFDGYAWSENLGWIHFRNDAPAYAVQTTARMPRGAVFIIR